MITFTYDDIIMYLAQLGHVTSGSFIVGFEGVVPAFKVLGANLVADYGGELLGALWRGPERMGCTQESRLAKPSRSDVGRNEDDSIVVCIDGKVGLCRGKVNADRASVPSRGAAQISYGPSRYERSDSPKLGADIGRPVPGDNVTYYDINLDKKVTLKEVADGALIRRDNRTILAHAMGGSAGCWGPTGGRSGAPWRLIRSMIIEQGEFTVYILMGEDFLRFLETPDQMPFLHVGQRGPVVKELQAKLGVTVDGDFGPKTARALLDNRSERPKHHPGGKLFERGCTVLDWDYLLREKLP